MFKKQILISLYNIKQLLTTPYRRQLSNSLYRHKSISSILNNNTIFPTSTNEYSGEILAKLAEQYPQAHGSLKNIMAAVAKELKNPNNFDVTYEAVMKSKHLTGWTCSVHLHWPSVVSFAATGKTKKEASNTVSLRVLQWLLNEGRIKGNQPILTTSVAHIIKKSNISISLDLQSLDEMQKLLNIYKESIAHLIEDAHKSGTTVPILKKRDTLACNMSETKRLRAVAARNKSLQRRARSRIENIPEQPLPIFQFRDEILRSVEENQVVVIKGEPGCGKSTQVPQYILDNAAMNGGACGANMIVTQPRRISAISLAERVAAERYEEVGDCVGYQVRFKSRLPRPLGGSIRFCSSGILLRILQSNPRLEGFSHIILDEAHERDVNTDMLMLLLRRVLSDNKDLKLIIMSATINPELFQKYYQSSAVLHIPGFTHPVQSFFLDDIKQVPLNHTRMSQQQKTPRIFHNEVADMIYWIHANKPEGAILCFLPGWQDIKAVSSYLEERCARVPCVILPLHSRLSLDDQGRVFRSPPLGVRKIVLSTNVAETSITIDDIAYVVETGCHKEERLSADQSSAILDDLWVSQANVNQRRGRAGRVRPGESYHLYTRDKFATLPPFPTPELHRVPLQKVVLDIKTYDESESAVEFLSQMPEPPAVLAISNAVNDLIGIGALTTEEKLTPLGSRIARFTTDPRLSKALIYATVFRCLDPMLTITSVLSSDADIFSGALEEKSEIAEIKRIRAPYSDHLAVLKLYNEWKQLIDNEESDELFCIRNMLRSSSFRFISRLREHSREQLCEAGMISSSSECTDLPTSDAWIIAILLSGTHTYLHQRNWDYKNGRIKLNSPSFCTETGSKASLLSDCTCHKKTLPSPILTYYNKQESAVRRTNIVRDASSVPPLAIPLFLPISKGSNVNTSNLSELQAAVVYNSKPLCITCSRIECEVITETQKMLEALVSYFVMVEGESKPESYYTMSAFRDDVTKVLSHLLQSQK